MLKRLIYFASAAACAVFTFAPNAHSAIASKKVVSGLQSPLFVGAPPGDTKRLFIVEYHAGNIRIFDLQTQVLQPAPFLTVAGITTGNEQGLLGLAFDPGYKTNGYFYVNFTTGGGGVAGHTEIARFQALGDPVTSISADASSKTLVLSYDQPESNHNGGWLSFGKDGYLYISAGDGGGANDRHGTIGNGQDRTSFLGKILRIDTSTLPYKIPADNPFKGSATFKQEIWQFGLRNPWRCSFDRLTGDLWIGDVGQDTREEIDFVPAGQGGLNFGWRPREGKIVTPAYTGSPYPAETPVSVVTDPLHDYDHATGVSVTGGYVYHGEAVPELQGKYLFADYGSARFWILDRAAGQTLVTEKTTELNPGSSKLISGISSFGEDGAGEIYFCDINHGTVFRIEQAQAASFTFFRTDVGPVFKAQFNAASFQTYRIEFVNAFDSEVWTSFGSYGPFPYDTNLTFSTSLQPGNVFYRIKTPQ
ncbi:MAG: hypothetical protein JWM04_2674 [Verrucomicrobiales bacterium]|nr:hypothetical protein [Verrucomicrobiales bacterium]